MQVISKARLSYLRGFLQKKVREEEGRFLIEGWHLLEEALRSGRRIESLVVDESAPREAAEEGILGEALGLAVEAWSASGSQVGQISDTKASQGVVALVEGVGGSFAELEGLLAGPGPRRVVALDGVGDPGNCGAILRACAWFGMDAVLCGTGSAELENGKTARASMGAIFQVPTAARVDLPAALGRLGELGYAVVTTELDGAVSLEGFAFPERTALVIGNEARGVSAAVSGLAAARVFVPRYGRGESLNAAAAAAVFLAAWRRG